MRFVIIGSPRTGSSYLTVKLREHPDILCHGEVFHQKNVWVYWPKRDLTDEVRIQLSEMRRTNPEALLERVFAANYGRPCVGFKIFGGQCDEILETIVGDPSIRKVVLFRRNILAAFSSARTAGRTGSWSTKEIADEPVTRKIEFDAGKFVRFHNEHVGFYRAIIGRLNENRDLFRIFGYEDINDPHLIASLVNFIGGDPRPSRRLKREQLKKQNPADILSRFSNPDDVVAFLADNRLLHWMHEAHPDIAPLALIGQTSVGARS